VGVPIEAPVQVGPEAVARRAHASGPGRVEAYTVCYGRDGRPERGIVVGRCGDGARFVANTPSDAAFLEAFAAREQVGRAGRVQPEGDRLRFDPA
jgi:acetyl-CoA C-acetyltransferase